MRRIKRLDKDEDPIERYFEASLAINNEEAIGRTERGITVQFSTKGGKWEQLMSQQELREGGTGRLMNVTLGDLILRNISDETHKILKVEVLNRNNIEDLGKECFVIESISNKPNWYYHKRIWWADKNNYIDYRQEFYNKYGKLIRTLDKSWEKIDGFWCWQVWDVTDQTDGSHSIIDFRTSMKINEDLAEDVFDEAFAKSLIPLE